MPSFPLSSFLRYSSPELNSDNVHCELMETFLFKKMYLPHSPKALDHTTHTVCGRSEHIFCQFWNQWFSSFHQKKKKKNASWILTACVLSKGPIKSTPGTKIFQSKMAYHQSSCTPLNLHGKEGEERSKQAKRKRWKEDKKEGREGGREGGKEEGRERREENQKGRWRGNSCSLNPCNIPDWTSVTGTKRIRETWDLGWHISLAGSRVNIQTWVGLT